VIPALDHRGLLPVGIHCCTLEQLELVFGGTLRRQQLVESLVKCTHLMHGAELAGDLIVNGSFVTDKLNPGDVELCLDVSRASVKVQANALLFHVQNHAKLDRMGVDWYPNLPESEDGLQRDFTRYFQYVGEKSAAMKRLDPRDLKGILKLAKW
jgi:hypothetical protein